MNATDLANIRHAIADNHFDSFDFGGFIIADYDGWKSQTNTDSMTRVVYFENGNEFSDNRASQTVKSIFTVQFFPISTKILDSTCTIDGNETFEETQETGYNQPTDSDDDRPVISDRPCDNPARYGKHLASQ